MAKLCDAALSGDKATCLHINEQLMPLHQSMFVESNPIPVKWAMHRMGMMGDEIRLPLMPLSSEHHAVLDKALHSLELI